MMRSAHIKRPLMQIPIMARHYVAWQMCTITICKITKRLWDILTLHCNMTKKIQETITIRQDGYTLAKESIVRRYQFYKRQLSMTQKMPARERDLGMLITCRINM